MARLLSLPVSTVAQMQATDVLAACVEDAERERDQRVLFELQSIHRARLTNLAVMKPEELQRVERDTMERAGIRQPTVSIEAFDAMLNGILPGGSDGAEG